MNLNTLSSSEKLAAYGAFAAIIGTLLTVIGGGAGVAGGLWLTLLLGVVMLAIVFMPQWSPQTSLPGSKGSLMLIVGAIAGIGALLGLLTLFAWIGLLSFAPLFVIGLIVGIVGGLLMGWAGWQAFQEEGGKFQLGSAGGSSGPGASTGHSAPPASRSEGGMGTGGSSMPTGGAASGGAMSQPASTTTEGMGSTGSPATSAGSTSAGSTDLGGSSAGTGSDEGTSRNP